MLVNKGAEIVWTVLNVRPKTLYDHKRLYIKHIDPIVGQSDLDSVDLVTLILPINLNYLDLIPAIEELSA